MPNYHNQSYITEVVQKINAETDANKQQIITQLKSLKQRAEYEVDKISAYTAPEEANRRRQSLYYYQDVLEELAK